jgi:hypothetical protein
VAIIAHRFDLQRAASRRESARQSKTDENNRLSATCGTGCGIAACLHARLFFGIRYVMLRGSFFVWPCLIT